LKRFVKVDAVMRQKLFFTAMLLGMLAEVPRLARAQTSAFASSSRTSASDFTESTSGYITLPPNPNKTNSYSRWSMTLKASTLGGGVDISRAIGQHLAVRGSVNVVDFAFPFSIDGVTYDSEFNFRSGGVSIDWFPRRGGLRISPGVLYWKNNLSALSSVPPGKYFELGEQGFINSVDDPLNGTAGVVFPRHVAPMITFGFRNLFFGKSKDAGRLSFPFEIGAAYSGAAKIDVTLNGTACTLEGCFTFAQNAEAQDSLKAEIRKLNNRLDNFPVYPIVSMGATYRF
jgi:hypothetical protein